MNMESIIQKAIEGGWMSEKLDDGSHWSYDWKNNPKSPYFRIDMNGMRAGCKVMMNEKLMFIDPLFWQALGKACGWKERKTVISEYHSNALRFHEINLTSSWEDAVKYLTDVIQSKNG